MCHVRAGGGGKNLKKTKENKTRNYNPIFRMSFSFLFSIFIAVQIQWAINTAQVERKSQCIENGLGQHDFLLRISINWNSYSTPSLK